MEFAALKIRFVINIMRLGHVREGLSRDHFIFIIMLTIMDNTFGAAA